MNIVATVCARGGSKGLPGKNVRDFAGQPLVARTVAQALACPEISRVYVSTDDDAIARAASAAGAVVPYRRPAELATDQAGKLPVIEHLVAHIESTGTVVDWVVDLQPTSPLRDSGDIAAAIGMATRERTDADLVLSVSQARDNPYYTLAEPDAQGWLRLSKSAAVGPGGGGAVRRQDLPAVYALNGAIYVWRRAALARACAHGLWSARALPYVMPRWKSVDIDDLEDFELALWLHQRHGGAEPPPQGGGHG